MDRIKQDKIATIVGRLSEKFSIQNLRFNTEGICALRIDSKFVVTIEIDSDTNVVRLFGVVTDVRKFKSGKMFVQLLSENFPSNDRGLNSIAIDKARAELILYSEMDVDHIDYEYFVLRLESFVNSLESHREKYENPQNTVFASQTSAPVNNAGTVNDHSATIRNQPLQGVANKLLTSR